jgi:hypothetical protein
MLLWRRSSSNTDGLDALCAACGSRSAELTASLCREVTRLPGSWMLPGFGLAGLPASSAAARCVVAHCFSRLLAGRVMTGGSSNCGPSAWRLAQF